MKGRTVRRTSKSRSLRDPAFLATVPDSWLTKASVKLRNKHRKRTHRKHKRR